MKRILNLILLAVLAWNSFSQSQIPLHQLNPTVAQANQLNPALFPGYKVIIGLPVMSSTYLSFNTDNISFRDVFSIRQADDSLQFDENKFLNSLNDVNRIDFDSEIALFYLGIRTKKNYLSLAVNEKIGGSLTYGKEAVEWILRGPAHINNQNKDFTFDDFSGRISYYHEVALGFGREITPKLIVGARVKALFGVVNVTADAPNGFFHAGVDSVSLINDAFTINTAGVNDFSNFDQNFEDRISGLKNRGYALDLGAKYWINRNLFVTASVNDLGYIKWKEFTKSYQVNAVNYSFKGFEVLDLLNNNISQNFIQTEIDSLENLYDPVETSGTSYKTSLTAKVYAGVNYQLGRVNTFGLLVYSDFFDGRISPAIGLTYALKLSKILNLTVGATYKNGSIGNIGGGISIRLGPTQIYVTSENALSPIYPARASRADVRLGMNLTFGKVRDQIPPKEETEIPEDTTTIEMDTTEVVIPEPEFEEDTVVTEVIPEDTIVLEPPVEEIAEDTVVVEEPLVVEDTVIVEEEPEVINVPPLVVRKGDHPLELDIGHYVIVGAFSIKENADNLAQRMQAAGYSAQVGYLTETSYFYVHVFFHSTDPDLVRQERNRLRSIPQFLLYDAWLLTVEE